MAEADAESTASYLACLLKAERGYVGDVPPEAAPLTEAVDALLVRGDGMSFQLIAIADAEQNPARRLGLTREQVVAVGQACLGYTGTVQGTKMPVAIQLWEVRRGPPVEEDRERLQKLTRRLPGREKVTVTAWSLDVDAARVWTSAGLGGWLAGRRYLERAMRQPRRAPLEPPPAAALAEVGRPWVSYGLLAALVLVFAGQITFGVRPWTGALAPDVLTLVAWGGLARALVEQGDWYRLLTAAFLHGDAFHLLFNGLALLLGATVLEALLGRVWLLALFVLGALGASALSLSWNPPEVISVGASGAILALASAAFVSAARLPAGAARTGVQMQLMRVLVPSLIPLATRDTGASIDFAGHFGGAIVGAAAGWCLLQSWPRSEPLPGFRRVAGGIVAAGALVLAAGAVGLARGHASVALAAQSIDYEALLIPDAELERAPDELQQASAGWVERYPRDPRGRLFFASHLAEKGDLAAAEQHLRAGLAETDILSAAFGNRRLEVALRGLLAQVRIAAGDTDGAREVVAPVCGAGEGGSVPDELGPLGLCPAPGGR